MRGATLNVVFPRLFQFKISIHAPRAGGDVRRSQGGLGVEQFQSTPPVRGATQMAIAMAKGAVISIHAPRAGGDTSGLGVSPAFSQFQSTPPVRGATSRLRYLAECLKFQSTPPVRGATWSATELQK